MLYISSANYPPSVLIFACSIFYHVEVNLVDHGYRSFMTRMVMFTTMMTIIVLIRGMRKSLIYDNALLLQTELLI